MIDIPLLLFAKAPIPGQVKTRLQPHCNAEQAAEIAKILMEASIRQTTRHWPGRVYLSVWPDQSDEFFASMQRRYSIELCQQSEGDLGAKMQHALHTYGYPAAVMGCDAPHISVADLRKAYLLLCQERAVIGPSDDGGYYLLGLSERSDVLFQDKSWGSSQVLSETLSAAASTQLGLTLLDSLNDVDEWDDLLEVARMLPPLADYLNSSNLVGKKYDSENHDQ